MILRVRPGASTEKKRAIVDGWYREEIRRAATPLITLWAPRLGVKVERFFVQRMKTEWGSCNSETRTIRLNTDLARKPPECLEYIVVHEMVHLLERHHSDRFRAYMDQFMPQWRLYRDELNNAPLAHYDWSY